MRDEVVRVGRVAVTRQTTIDDKYLSQRPAQRHRCRQPCVTSTDDDHVVFLHAVNGFALPAGLAFFVHDRDNFMWINQADFALSRQTAII